MSNSSICRKERTLSGTTIQNQSGTGSDGTEEVLKHSTNHRDWVRVLSLCRDVAGIFYSHR